MALATIQGDGARSPLQTPGHGQMGTGSPPGPRGDRKAPSWKTCASPIQPAGAGTGTLSVAPAADPIPGIYACCNRRRQFASCSRGIAGPTEPGPSRVRTAAGEMAPAGRGKSVSCCSLRTGRPHGQVETWAAWDAGAGRCGRFYFYLPQFPCRRTRTGSTLTVDDVLSVLECPGGQRNQQGAQLVASVGQTVVHPWRNDGLGRTPDQAVTLQSF